MRSQKSENNMSLLPFRQPSSAAEGPPAAWGVFPDLQYWHRYFAVNALRPDEIPWEYDTPLANDERQCIQDSIAAFQLGEYSEGHNLLRFARAYAQRCGDDTLVQITRYFIKEEQQHALMLKRFMVAQGLEAIQRNWTDTVFRRLRRYVGYELSITVLITAEIIALVYYGALQRCTASGVLEAICARILDEEAAHVRYESAMIRYLRAGHSALRRRLTALGHRVLFAGTVLVVFGEHRKVLGRGGYALQSFWAHCWHEFERCFRVVQS
jgi:hypothetical protein